MHAAIAVASRRDERACAAWKHVARAAQQGTLRAPDSTYVARAVRQDTLRAPAWTYVAHAERQGILRGVDARCAGGAARHVEPGPA